METQINVHHQIQKALLAWYGANRRDLPWRQTADPYAIWVSEIMLQQTQVETVIPYYRRFLERFPTIQALAASELEEVLGLWKGLGYYTRARNLHLGARYVVDMHHGRMPDTFEGLRKVPGIGIYTAGAVLSIAYQLPYPAVDGNVLRVFSRVFLIEGDIGLGKTQKDIQALVQQTVPADTPGDFNQAVMDLGSGICIPFQPKCGECPLSKVCRAHHHGVQNALPRKQPRPEKRRVERVVCLIRHDERFLLVRRPDTGLFAGLWDFPGFDAPCEDNTEVREHISKWMASAFGLKAEGFKMLFKARHVFTHMLWNMQIYVCEASQADESQAKGLLLKGSWFTPGEISRLPIPSAYKSILAWILDTVHR